MCFADDIKFCQSIKLEFFVSATNEAGTGPSTRIVDTVHIPTCKLLNHATATFPQPITHSI